MFVIYKRYTSAHPWVPASAFEAPGSLPLLPLESLQSRDATLVPCPECGQQVGMQLGGALEGTPEKTWRNSWRNFWKGRMCWVFLIFGGKFGSNTGKKWDVVRFGIGCLMSIRLFIAGIKIPCRFCTADMPVLQTIWTTSWLRSYDPNLGRFPLTISTQPQPMFRVEMQGWFFFHGRLVGKPKAVGITDFTMTIVIPHRRLIHIQNKWRIELITKRNFRPFYRHRNIMVPCPSDFPPFLVFLVITLVFLFSPT